MISSKANRVSRSRSAHRTGFSLVELMVVICIIGVLGSLAMFSFSKIRGKVRCSSCRQNLRVIHLAAVSAQNLDSAMSGKNLTVTRLFDGGYLRSIPKCPCGGSYAVTNEDSHLRVTCFKTSDGSDHGSYE